MPFVGIGVGIGRQRFAQGGIFAAYAARVAADGGVTEAGSCVNAVSGISLNSSLLLVPSGYKSGVVYSEIPTNGDGDLTFTRASSATRVNSAGLIESPRTNTFLYSEQFDNAYWVKTKTTITINDIAAPDGTITAEKLEASITATDVRIQRSGSISAGLYTNSIYVKAAELNIIRMYAVDFSSQATFTLSGSGSISSIIGSATPKIVSVGDGWYRCSMSLSFAGGSTQILYLNLGGGATITAGDGVYIWGAQLETGSTATEYIPTTNSERTTFAGITQDGTSASNVPRLDYSQGSCPALLLEPQRTNLALYSEQFDNANWNFYFGTQVANTTETLDPSGYYGAEKVIMGSGNQAVYRQSIGGLTNGATYTLSLYIKQGSGVTAFLDISDTSSTVNITPTGEWVRYTKTGVWNTSANYIDLEFRGTSGSAYCYLWGAQLELGSYATSYIPTTSATVTRLADSAVKTGISSLIGQTEGTLYWEGRIISGVGTDLLIIGTTQNSIFLNLTTTTSLKVGVRANFTLLLNAQSTTLSGTYFKIAVAYKSGDIVAYVNGAQVITNSTSFTFSDLISSIEIGRPFYDAKATQFNQASALFTTRLTNTQLAELTTL
jgi:hypothetical protein